MIKKIICKGEEFYFKPISAEEIENAANLLTKVFCETRQLMSFYRTYEHSYQLYRYWVEISVNQKMCIGSYNSANQLIGVFVVVDCSIREGYDPWNDIAIKHYPAAVKAYNKMMDLKLQFKEYYLAEKFGQVVNFKFGGIISEYVGYSLPIHLYDYCMDEHEIISKYDLIVGECTSELSRHISLKRGFSILIEKELIELEEPDGSNIFGRILQAYKRLGLPHHRITIIFYDKRKNQRSLELKPKLQY